MRALGLVVLLLVGSSATTGCARPNAWLRRPLIANEQLVPTPDGGLIQMLHYEAVGTQRGPPVLLIHGLSANSRNLDVDDEHSLAIYMARQGREVWSLSTRVTVLQPDGRPGRTNFDTIWREDVATAVKFARENSHPPAEKIDAVGHSMGGLLLYAYLSQGGEGIRATATLGSPTRLDWGSPLFTILTRSGTKLFDPEGTIPTMAFVGMLRPFHGLIPDAPFENIFYNSKNISRGTWRALLAVGLDDIPTRLWAQFLKWIESGRFGSDDGRIDYRASMARIRTPVLVVAGRMDRVAIPPAVWDGYRALGGPKEWLLLGEENGVAHDYGHMDLVAGDRAATEVWSKVVAFLDRAGAGAPAGTP